MWVFYTDAGCGHCLHATNSRLWKVLRVRVHHHQRTIEAANSRFHSNSQPVVGMD